MGGEHRDLCSTSPGTAGLAERPLLRKRNYTDESIIDGRSEGSESPKREEEVVSVPNLEKAKEDKLFPKNAAENLAGAIEHYKHQSVLFSNLDIDDENFVNKLDPICLPYMPNIFDNLITSVNEYRQSLSSSPAEVPPTMKNKNHP